MKRNAKKRNAKKRKETRRNAKKRKETGEETAEFASTLRVLQFFQSFERPCNRARPHSTDR